VAGCAREERGVQGGRVGNLNAGRRVEAGGVGRLKAGFKRGCGRFKQKKSGGYVGGISVGDVVAKIRKEPP